MSKILESVAKKIWYQAGGRCAFPHRQELSFPDTGKLFGQIAHIVAGSTKGPRGDADYPEEKLNECENLILLCPEHHEEVDGNTQKWTVEKLCQLKQDHEEWVRQRLKWSELPIGAPQPAKMLVVLWGASSAGKDVVLNRILLRLEEHCLVRDLQRYTTRPRRPEESEQTPFEYLDGKDEFNKKVSEGAISCFHAANGNYYGFDSRFADEDPPGTVVLTCMRQYNYLNELSVRASAHGLAVYNILLIADYDTLHARTLLRGTLKEEKNIRMKALKRDVDWFAQNKDSGAFDLVIDNSDNSCLNDAVQLVYDFIMRKRGGVGK